LPPFPNTEAHFLENFFTVDRVRGRERDWGRKRAFGKKTRSGASIWAMIMMERDAHLLVKIARI